MTWETYATGVISVPDDIVAVQGISAENGYVDIILTDTPTTEPTKFTWELKIDNIATTVDYCVFDGDVTVRYYFEPLTVIGFHTAAIGEFTDTFEVL